MYNIILYCNALLYVPVYHTISYTIIVYRMVYTFTAACHFKGAATRHSFLTPTRGYGTGWETWFEVGYETSMACGDMKWVWDLRPSI